MRKLIVALMLLMAPVTAPAEAEPLTPLEYSCAVLDLDCHNIPMPTIIYTDLLQQVGALGAYVHGENHIFIRHDAPAFVVVHEVTHYVLYEAGLRYGRCTSEEIARKVHHEWEGTVYDDSWRAQYGC